MRTVLFAGGLLGLATLMGCQQSNATDENALLLEENQGLRAQLQERSSTLDMIQRELDSRDLELADARRQLENAQYNTTPVAYDASGGMNMSASYAQPAAVPTYPAPANDPFSAIDGVTGSYENGEITASVASDVLFDPGKTTLKRSAKASLDAVARVIRNSYSGKTVRVAGHTDTDPIRKSGYKSNYHLAFERAYAVRDYLVQKGIPSSQVYIASHGPDKARGSKKESRRVEIAVVVNE